MTRERGRIILGHLHLGGKERLPGGDVRIKVIGSLPPRVNFYPFSLVTFAKEVVYIYVKVIFCDTHHIKVTLG